MIDPNNTSIIEMVNYMRLMAEKINELDRRMRHTEDWLTEATRPGSTASSKFGEPKSEKTV